MGKRNITPRQAEQMLATPVRNRPIRERVWKLFARDMAAGRWVTEASPPILIDKDTGGVLDGRHRLLAVADQLGDFVFVADVREVDKLAITVIDTGTPRSLSDTLTIEGHEDVTAKSAFLNTAAWWGMSSTASQVLSRSEQVAWLEANPNLQPIVAFGRKLRNRPKTDVLTLPVGTLMTLWDVVEFSFGGNEIEHFAFTWLDGDHGNDMLKRAAKTIRDSRNPRSKVNLSARQLSFLLARVCVAWLNEEKLTKLYARRRSLETVPGYAEWVHERWGPYLA